MGVNLESNTISIESKLKSAGSSSRCGSEILLLFEPWSGGLTDVDCCVSSEGCLSIGGGGGGCRSSEADYDSANPHGYLPEHRYSSSLGSLVLHGNVAAGHGGPYRVQFRAGHHHHRQRYRAHGVSVGKRPGRDQGFFPSGHERSGGCRPDHRDCTNYGARLAARHDTTADYFL